MAVKHKLKIKKSGNKVDYDYEKDGSPTPASQAIPYLVVKPKEEVEFEAPTDGVLIVAFGPDGSPFDGASVFVVKKGKSVPKTVREQFDEKIVGYKYTTVLLEDLTTGIFVDDPQIIIDNNG